MNRRVVRALAALALALLLPLVGATPPVPAAAQQPDADPGDAPARITLAGIDATVASGTEARWAVLVEHAGDVAWERVEVVAELHGALGSRSALRVALAGGAVPPPLQRAVVASASAPLTPGGVMRISGAVPLTGSALSGPASAVHPLRLRVLADGEEVGRIDTAIVRVGSGPSATLATTLVWPLSAPPARDADGDPAGVLDPLTVPGAALDTLLAALAPVVDPAASPALAALAPAIALAAPAHLVEDLALRATDVPVALVDDLGEAPPLDVDEAALRAARLLQRLRSTALALPSGPLTAPYGDADLTRMLASGATLRQLATRAAVEEDARAPQLLGRTAAPVMLLGAPTGPAVLQLLPGRVLLLPHAAIEAPDLALDVPLGEPVRALRSPTGRLFTVLVGDPHVATALGASTRARPGDPVRAAHEVMVHTAMVHLEAPGRTGRALVLLPPDGFDPDPRFAAELLTRLAAAPWLTPLPPERVAVVEELPEPVRLASGTVAPLSPRLVNALATTARDLELLVGAVGPAEETTGEDVPIGGRALGDASDELLRAASRAYAPDVEPALALLAGVRAGVDAAFGTVTLAIDDVTLTAEAGTIPITLGHTGGVPVRVRLEVTGPSALAWTDGRVRELVLDVDVERAIEVPVRSGASGRFPVTVRVTDPTGERLLADTVISVRATAVARPALALIAATVLVLTVVGTLRQRRRGLAWRTVDPDGVTTVRTGGGEVQR